MQFQVYSSVSFIKNWFRSVVFSLGVGTFLMMNNRIRNFCNCCTRYFFCKTLDSSKWNHYVFYGTICFWWSCSQLIDMFNLWGGNTKKQWLILKGHKPKTWGTTDKTTDWSGILSKTLFLLHVLFDPENSTLKLHLKMFRGLKTSKLEPLHTSSLWPPNVNNVG